MRKPSVAILSLAAALVLFSAATRSDERLAGVAARSVHLQYDAPAGVAFYNEVTVERSAVGTYFCVCGFDRGYFGLQELGGGKKVGIFSVWDPGKQNDPNVVPEDRRVKVLHTGEAVRVSRFGNEGTGGKSMWDFDWKPGETYRFLVTAAPDGDDRTAYAAHLYLPAEKAWKHLVTFSTLAKGGRLGGYYGFVEDFRRNRDSASRTRTAAFGNGWVKGTDGRWTPLATARFTADSNPAKTIDADVKGGRFVLSTGGAIENAGTPLGETMTVEVAAKPPADLPIAD